MLFYKIVGIGNAPESSKTSFYGYIEKIDTELNLEFRSFNALIEDIIENSSLSVAQREALADRIWENCQSRIERNQQLHCYTFLMRIANI